MISWMFWAFCAVISVIAIACVVSGLLKGRKNSWQFSVAKVATLLVSLILSIILTKVISKALGSVVLDALYPTIKDSVALSELMSSLDSMSAAVKAIVAMIIAPIIFVTLFSIVRALVGISTKPLARLVLKLSKKDTASLKSEHSFDAAGAACGALCAFVTFVAICAPIVGYFTIANDAVMLAGDDIPEVIVTVADSAANNPATKAIKILGGDAIYNSITTYDVNGDKARLSNELGYIDSLGVAVYELANDSASDAKKAQAIRATVPKFEKATILPKLGAEFICAASEDWSHNRDFCTIEPIAKGTDFEPALKQLYRALGNSTADTLRADYKTIANTAAIIVEEGAADALGGDFLNLFKNEQLVSDVMLEMLSNERLAPAVEGFANAGIGVIAKTLGVYDNTEQIYTGFIDDMVKEYKRARAWTNEYSKFDQLSNSIVTIYDKYGVEINEGIADCIALAMLDNDNLDDADNMRIFFGADATEARPILASGFYGGMMLAGTAEKATVTSSSSIAALAAKLANSNENIDEFVKEFSEALRNESKFYSSLSDIDRGKVEAKISDAIYTAKESGKEIKYDAAVIAGVDEIAKVTVRITKDQLEISLANVKDFELEAKALAKVFSATVDITDKLSKTDDIVELIKELGPVLDSFAECESIGKDGASSFVSAIIQSDPVQNNVGFSTTQAAEIADTINNNANNVEGESYTGIMNSVGQTIEIIKDTNDKKDTTKSIEELLADLTPASAETLKQMSTPETLIKHGVEKKYATNSAKVLADMFCQMSVAKQNGMSDAQYAAEAEAVRDLLNVAINIGKSEWGDSVFGKNSVTGLTATEYVERLVKSEIASKTVTNASYNASDDSIKNNPLGMARKLTDAEKTELVSALDAKWKAQLAKGESAAENTAFSGTLRSISALLGIETVVEGNSIVLK